MSLITMPSYKLSQSAKEIASELIRIGSIRYNVENPFIWASGIKSPIYCDNRRVNSIIKTRNLVLNAFLELIENEFEEFDIIGGVATGGMPMGALIAHKLKLPFIYIRQTPKKHGLMKQVEGEFKSGDIVILIEDLVSTGGSSLKAIQGLREQELELLGLVSIMTYGFEKAKNLFLENKIHYYSLCDLDTILEVSQELGLISKKEKFSILEFKENPAEWGEKMK